MKLLDKNKKVVLFDIDYTLFNTKLYRRSLYKLLAKVLGHSPNKIALIERRIAHGVGEECGYLNLTLFLQRFSKKLKEEKDVITKVYFDEDTFKKCLYRETEEIVENLSKQIIIGIFSKGDNFFQRAKIISIKHAFQENHVHISVNKHTSLPKLVNTYKSYKLYLVDDALDVLAHAKILDENITTIWVKRGRFAKTQEPISGFTPDETVLNLRRIAGIVKKDIKM